MKCSRRIHRTNTTACVINAGEKAAMSAELTTNAAGPREFYERMNRSKHEVMMGSSTYSYVAYRFFERLGVETHVVLARSLRS